MDKELSLVISDPREGEFLKTISWNKEEFMELVASITEQYEGLTYTEDQIKAAKSDRARLNAMKKAISGRRIQVKKAFMEPYTKFEAEVAEVTALIDNPIAMIDGQIKKYEDRIKAEKKSALKEYFEEIASDLESIFTFNMAFDQRYLNVSVSLNKAKDDIKGKVDQVRTDLRCLEGFCEEKYLAIAKDAYIRTLNVSDALAEARRLQEFDRKAEEEAKEARLAAEAKAVETKTAENVTKLDENVTEPAKSVSKPIESVTGQAEVAPAATPAEPSIDTPDTSVGSKKAMETEEDSKLFKSSFTVYGTKAQIMDLREYMVQHGIKFGKVEK